MNHAISSPVMTGAGRLPWMIDRLIDLIVILWLLLLSDAVIPLMMLGGQEDFTDAQKAQLQNLFKPFIVISLGLFFLSFKGMTTIFVRNPMLILLLFWMWASAAWSMDSDVSLRRSLLHSSFVLMACFMACRYTFEEIIRLLFIVTIAVILASFYFILFDTFLGFNPDGRGARGAFLHKNGLGSFLVVGIAVAASALRLRIVPRLIGLGVLAATLVLLILANSASALLAIAVMFGIYVLVALKERLPSRTLAVLVAFSLAFLAFGLMLLIANIDEIFSMLGRDATLTGRDEVWHYALSMARQRMFLGYGYSAFWEIEPVLSYVNDTLNWHITHAHNGFLQVWLELGLIGMALLIIFLIASLLRAIFGTLPQNAQIFVLPFFTALIVSDLVETHLFVYKHFGWIIMLIIVFAITPGLNRTEGQTSKAPHAPNQPPASTPG